jgi:carbonic anhydrase
MPYTWDSDSPSPDAALARLIDGNRRFREERVSNATMWSRHLAAGQRPFAIVLGCSDSRMPVEIVFDQGFGDLFVVRVAGNIVAPSIVGSIEFAASQFGTRLVVVMGHTRCGAISATMTALSTGHGPESKNVRSITDRIAPHIEPFMGNPDPERAFLDAVRANVRASTDHLKHGSKLLEDLVLAERLAVVGALYDLETGGVTFLDRMERRSDRPPQY